MHISTTLTKTLTKTNITYLVKFFILLTVATIAPVLGFHSQWITGPIVNMALILSVFVVGARGALLIAVLPSTIALSTGLLPPVFDYTCVDYYTTGQAMAGTKPCVCICINRTQQCIPHALSRGKYRRALR